MAPLHQDQTISVSMEVVSRCHEHSDPVRLLLYKKELKIFFLKLTFWMVTLAATQNANHNYGNDNDENGGDDRHDEIKIRNDESNCVFGSELWDAVVGRNCH